MAVPFAQSVVPEGLMRQVAASPAVMRGSLITFNYIFHKPGHDPAPMVIVTDTGPAYIRGVNLHYLTFPVIKKMMFPAPGRSVCDSPVFTYQYIKGNSFITSAFRQYKVSGIQNVRKLDCEFLVNSMAVVRSFDPNEIEAIRKTVRDQIRRMVNEPAAASPATNI